MVHFLFRRLAIAVSILLAVSLLVFIGCQVLPGDMAEVSLGQFATPESVAALREQLGLGRPASIRYLEWLGGILRGDWGLSLMTRVPVSQLLSERLANTALLTAATAVIAFPVAVLLGLFMALKPRSWFDRGASLVVLGLAAMPEFLIGTALVIIFAVNLRWLPAVSYTGTGDLGNFVRGLALPVATLVLVVVAQIARMTRATILNIQEASFIEMARLKGLSKRRVVFYHALINVAGPLANIIALNLAYLVSGIVVVETIFAYPGLARLMIDAVSARDLPVIQACAMVFCAAYVLLMALSDILAVVFNPRLRTALGKG